MSNNQLSRDQVRQVDKIAIEQYGMTGLVLMENAGRSCAERVYHLASRLGAGVDPTVLILCGKGNNAGDGYVIARHLELLGMSVQLVSLVPLNELRGDALVNAKIAQAGEIPLMVSLQPQELQRLLFSAGVIVDCMLGTGAIGAPKEPYATAIRLANHASGLRVAIDIPTGLDCDTGEVSEPTFRADHTLTFVAVKAGFISKEAKSALGEVEVLGIGVPRKLLQAFGLEV